MTLYKYHSCRSALPALIYIFYVVTRAISGGDFCEMAKNVDEQGSTNLHLRWKIALIKIFSLAREFATAYLLWPVLTAFWS